MEADLLHIPLTPYILWKLSYLEGPALRTAIVTKENASRPAGRECVPVRVYAGAILVVPAWQYNC